jgi:TonB family protein
MKSNRFHCHLLCMRRASLRLMQTVALAFLRLMALHGSVAEERAVKSRVAPTYTEIARRMKISGVVRLEVSVDPEGKVTDVKQLSGNNMLSVAAEDAVRRWRFVSAPSASTVEVALNFALQ